MKSVLMTLMLLVAASFAQAADFSVDSFNTRISPAVSESFRLTCDVVYEDRYRIQAYCEDTRGRMVWNDFDRSYCRGDIANMNGRLTCSHSGGGHGGSYLPRGSYQLTCRGCQANGYELSCRCKDMDGYYQHTYLYNYRSCRGDIANINGRLQCNH